MTFVGKRSEGFHNFTMDVDPSYKYKEKFRVGLHWHTMGTKDLIPKTNIRIKEEGGNLVSFDGQ